jgi:hypothetical protein
MAVPSLLTVLKVAAPSGVLAGLAMGVIARISMRAFALAEGDRPTFSVGGTLAVLFVFAVILGIPLALPYVRYWRLLSLPGAWLGVAYGAALLLLLVVIPFLVIPSDEANLRTRLLAIAVFIPVPLAYGLALGRLAESFLNRI